MWFYAEMNRNPDFLEDVVSEKDVQEIIEVLELDPHDSKINRIKYELSMSGSPNDYGGKLPLITEVFDVLDEFHLKSKRYSIEVMNLRDLVSKLNKLEDLITNKNIQELIIATGDFDDTDFNRLYKDMESLHSTVSHLLKDINNNKKAHHKSRKLEWGNLGGYKLFIGKCAQLYSDLAGKPFTAEFHRSHKKSPPDPVTDGTKFAFIFHNILNRVSEKYSSHKFTNSNLETACIAVTRPL